MSINEIIILLLGIIISITLLLMFRRLFFGKKSSIEINKKVNSRELFEPVQAVSYTHLTLPTNREV